MAHGPAIMARAPPPIFTLPTVTTVSFLVNSRLASLNGFMIGSTCSTPAIACSGSACSLFSSPMTPMMVRCSPGRDVRLEAELMDALDDVIDLGRRARRVSRR